VPERLSLRGCRVNANKYRTFRHRCTDVRGARSAWQCARATNFAAALTNLTTGSLGAALCGGRRRRAPGALNRLALKHLRAVRRSRKSAVAQPLRYGAGVARRIAAQLFHVNRGRAANHASHEAAHFREDLMSQLINLVKSFGRQEEGQDLLEYALLVALIALIAIGAVGLAGESVATIFNNIAGRLAAAA
jgi:Flp pilus assembly pilin Flp